MSIGLRERMRHAVAQHARPEAVAAAASAARRSFGR
jgi:hypothetical protein